MSGLIVLLSCGKKKQNRECPASEMYTSSLFRKSLQLARRLTDDRHIYILSAKYGLLPLRERIRPYEMCLNTFTERERERRGGTWSISPVRRQGSVSRTASSVWLGGNTHRHSGDTSRTWRHPWRAWVSVRGCIG